MRIYFTFLLGLCLLFCACAQTQLQYPAAIATGTAAAVEHEDGDYDVPKIDDQNENRTTSPQLLTVAPVAQSEARAAPPQTLTRRPELDSERERRLMLSSKEFRPELNTRPPPGVNSRRSPPRELVRNSFVPAFGVPTTTASPTKSQNESLSMSLVPPTESTSSTTTGSPAKASEPVPSSTSTSTNTGLETHHKVLDHEGNVALTWQLDLTNEVITFEVVAKTLGYIGFGLNLGGGGMEGADIVIGGVFSNENTYFADYHGIGNLMPVLDQHQSWRFLSAGKNESHTTLKFSRAFDTCDPEDVVINNDTLNIIWALGNPDGESSDRITYHLGNRGTGVVNFLDPPYPNLDDDNLPTFEFSVEMVMPESEFTYWCTAHRTTIDFKGKAHLVGFRPKLYGPVAVQHTHHFVLYKCNDDPAAVSALDAKMEGEGEDCYAHQSPNMTTTVPPMNFLCRTMLYIWGSGGEAMILPEHVGYPIGLSPNEYFMLEVHFDNPAKLQNVSFRAGVEILYTRKLRRYDAAMMAIGHATIPSLFIPPMTANWKIQGHCSSECTMQFIPAKGIQLINAMLHSHHAGRKMKLRHFRGNEELPWISYDDHYHFDYQKNRPIRNERTVLPGDQLTFECVYSTVDRPNVTLGGFSTVNEMCETFLWYYPAIPHAIACTSFIPPEVVFPKYGIQKLKSGNPFDQTADLFIEEPAELAGKLLSEVLNTRVPWSEGVVRDLQSTLLGAPQIASCPVISKSVNRNESSVIGSVLASSPPSHSQSQPQPSKMILARIPFLTKLYQPPPTCTQRNGGQKLMFYGGMSTQTPAPAPETPTETVTEEPETTDESTTEADSEIETTTPTEESTTTARVGNSRRRNRTRHRKSKSDAKAVGINDVPAYVWGFLASCAWIARMVM